MLYYYKKKIGISKHIKAEWDRINEYGIFCQMKF